MNIKAREMLVSVLKHPYAWPGGYERLIVTADGGLLCCKCVKKEASRIMSAIRDGYPDDKQWLPAGTTYEAISPDCCDEEHKLNCDHCGKEIGELGC